MINKSFNNFVNKKQLNEIAGRGGHLSAAKKRLGSLELPTGYPGLYSVLNLIHNPDIRRNFLIWIVGEGLMKASEGREELLFLLKNNPNKILKEQNLNFYKFQQLKEMSRGYPKGRGAGVNTITSHDIFSNIARNRNKNLGNMADKIDKYYEENYEPKQAVFVSKSGYMKINLEELRKKCQELGLPEFKYGGTDGYIQYTEKGDWKDDYLKGRDMNNPNEQWGPDLRPDTEVKDNEGNILPTITRNTKKKKNGKKSDRTVYHFVGGPYEEVPNQISAVLKNMSSEYSKIMRKSESDPVLSSEFENFKRFGKKIETFEEFEKYLETKKGSILQKIGFPDYKESAEFMPIPKFVSSEFFKDMVLNGIKKTYFNEDESTQKKIFENIFRREGFIKTRIRWNEIVEAKTEKEIKENQYKKVLLSKLLTNSLKDKNYLKGLFDQRFAIYVSSEEKHGPDIHKTATKDYLLDVNFENPNDSSMGNTFLEKLISNGFYWEKYIGIKKIRINENPFFNDPDLKKIKLTNKKEVYIVYKKDNKFYINMPDVNGKGIPDNTERIFGNPVLGSSKITIRGQKTDDHRYTNPGSKEQTDRLIEQLKRGLLGEAPEKVDRTIPPENWQSLPVIFNDVIDLPSVKFGVKMAKSWSQRNHIGYFDNKKELWFAWYQEISGESDNIPGFAVEAIQALEMNSNEKSFLSGWITEEEINNFKKTIKRGTRFRSLPYELDNYGLEPETKKELENLIEKNPTMGHNLEHKALTEILGKNALLWRANTVALNVKQKIDIEIRKYLKEQEASLDASSGNDDSGTMAGNIGSRGYESQRDYEGDNSKHLTRSQIEDLIQQHGMTPEIQTPSIPSSRSSTRIKSRPVFDPSKFIPRYKDQGAGAVADAQTSSTPVFDPSKFRPRYKDQGAGAVADAPTSSTPVFDPSKFIPRYKDQGAGASTSAETPKQELNKYEPLKSYRNWKQKNEMVGTFVVSPKKPKDGCGYNIWGAAGKPAVSITGEPIKKKKKKKNGK